MTFEPQSAFAENLDKKDPLGAFRSKFHIPEKHGREVIYLCGNSLGLQPKSTKTFITQELESWAELGVEGHFRGKRPWVNYHEYSKKYLKDLLGARAHEVVSMGSLTENLHLLLSAFYRPEGKKTKMLIEHMAFPSDHYAVWSQLKLRGFNEDHLIIMKPDQGYNYSNDHILKTIDQHKEELALILLPGVQYYSGQLFDIHAISNYAAEAGIRIGFDLAHAVGNVPLELHNDQVDFATWCSYKYLNSGPGGISGIFVHENNLTEDLQLKGWWGHNPGSRFRMNNKWEPAEGVDAWQLSNPNILAAAANLASLEIFDEAGVKNIRSKSKLLTGYLEYLLKQSSGTSEFQVITPTNPYQRGAQLSLKSKLASQKLVSMLEENRIVLDYREPDVIRIAPVPLYNTYTDVWQFVDVLNQVLPQI